MACAFNLLKKEEYEETSKFCCMFDRFFDCLNTRRAGEGKEKRKPDLDPYRSVNDIRLTVCKLQLKCIHMYCIAYVFMQWLETDFLGYLRNWEESVKKRDGYTDEEKKRMILSQETLQGIRMTGDFMYMNMHIHV